MQSTPHPDRDKPSASLHRVAAEAAEAEALALVGAATFLETYAGRLPGPAIVAHCARHHTAQAWRGALAAAGAACWLALAQDGAPVGYALLTAPDLPGQRAGDVELRRIYVLSRWHGGGLGSALMQVALVEGQRRGAGRLLLGVWARNAAALRFYERQGFAPVGTRQFTVGDLVCDDLVLAREIGAEP
jgi:ribosomal protein S18 acetylase RimI-like enzyme